MAARFLHVGFSWSGPPKIDKLEPIFNVAIDWIRYAPNCWILRTTSDADTWFARLKPHMADGDQVFIAELDLSDSSKYSGWLDKWMWPRLESPKL